MCVYILAYTYICIHIHICVYMYTYIHIHACMHAYIRTYIRTYIHTYLQCTLCLGFGRVRSFECFVGCRRLCYRLFLDVFHHETMLHVTMCFGTADTMRCSSGVLSSAWLGISGRCTAPKTLSPMPCGYPCAPYQSCEDMPHLNSSQEIFIDDYRRNCCFSNSESLSGPLNGP